MVGKVENETTEKAAMISVYKALEYQMEVLGDVEVGDNNQRFIKKMLIFVDNDNKT